MKERLFTIPVSDAFHMDCECPVCAMRSKLETDLIDFTMGPSYMEDDVREMTSHLGFCERHIELLYRNQNRLGLALILKSHMDKTIKDMEKLTGASIRIPIPSLFKKKTERSDAVNYLDNLEESCFICSRMEETFDRYIATIFYLYKTDDSFRSGFKETKGFCNKHYKVLAEAAPTYLDKSALEGFMKELGRLYLDHMKRVRDDLEWFINKFDYRYANEPWKNSMDALPRAIQKINGVKL